VSPTTAAHVLADLRGRIELILDGGPTRMGLESTIVACLGEPMLLRPGALARDEIERVLGAPLAAGVQAATDAPVSPGQLASHYAPRARLRLDATAARSGEALLAFGPELPPGAEGATRVLNLSERGDLIEAAANLFSHLRALDTAAGSIAVMPVPHEGLGEAINDRLARAAAPRES
jgi:L-threonylcarbamoyladenylate synthase